MFRVMRVGDKSNNVTRFYVTFGTGYVAKSIFLKKAHPKKTSQSNSQEGEVRARIIQSLFTARPPGAAEIISLILADWRDYT
jgi:predicted oxidoreductase